MKVLHVIWHLGQGGAQTYLLQLINKIRQLRSDIDQEVMVLASRGSLSSRFDESGIKTSYLGMKSGLDVTRGKDIYSFLAGSSADIIHSHSNNLLLNLVFNFQKKPVIYTEHGGDLFGGRRRDRLIYMVLYRPIREFFAISEVMAVFMKNINEKIRGRIVVIPNGIDIEGQLAIESVGDNEWNESVKTKSFQVGIIGRLVEQKGIDLFIEVATLIAKQRDDVGFVIVGDGPLRESLERLSEKNQISDRVSFVGYKSNGISWLKRFDVFLFTSKFEPFGLVIIEAMANWIPVVAAHRSGAVSEIVKDGVSGLVVNGEDAAMLAAAVCRVLDDEQLRSSMVTEARREVAARYSIKYNATQVVEAYDRIA